MSMPGDTLFIHYSGHGTQVPTPPNPGNFYRLISHKYLSYAFKANVFKRA